MDPQRAQSDASEIPSNAMNTCRAAEIRSALCRRADAIMSAIIARTHRIAFSLFYFSVVVRGFAASAIISRYLYGSAI
jgi:hypothetical protein